MKVLRYTDEWVGLLVLLGAALFIAAVLEAGVVGGLWFHPVVNLRVLLPESGGQGLSTGADVEVLGTPIGTVRQVVIDPNQRFYADVDLERAASVFIRSDSTAIIKKRYGIAGASYLDITRGTGAPFDWKSAVIEARSERDPGESASAMLDEVKRKVLPIIDDMGRAMRALADTTEAISQGRGDVGRFVRDEEIANAAARLLNKLDDVAAQADSAVVRLRAATETGPQSVPALLKRLDDVLASLQSASRDVSKATPMLPGIARNTAGSTADLPALLTQTQQSMAELERLLFQLRHTWPLSGAAAPEAQRLPPSEVRP
jgi:phospholipid/cholesterol/gamma-HCH transport system substrate-binding protein